MKKWLVMVLVLSVAACDASVSPNERGTDTAIVRWGTSFGMCMGYCVEELEIDGSVLRLSRQGSASSDLPPQTEERALSNLERQEVLDRLEAANLEDLQEVYGCPDCADGGAEWVELESGGSRTRVTFEFSRPPDELQSVVAELRALRERFPTP